MYVGTQIIFEISENSWYICGFELCGLHCIMAKNIDRPHVRIKQTKRMVEETQAPGRKTGTESLENVFTKVGPR